MEKIYRFMGLALRAGLLISGSELCEKKLKNKGFIKLIIVSEDASENTKKKFFDKCLYRGVKVIVFGEKDLIGKFLGKSERSVVGLLDSGFSDKLLEMVESINKNGGDAHG